jgi:hypothetical protein
MAEAISLSDTPVLRPTSRSRQLEEYGWQEVIDLNACPTGIALFFEPKQKTRVIPIYLANATGSPLKSVFVSDAGFNNFDAAHEDTQQHVRALRTIEHGKGLFLDACHLDLRGDLCVTYTVIATNDHGIRYSGTASFSRRPRDGWTIVHDWAPIPL